MQTALTAEAIGDDASTLAPILEAILACEALDPRELDRILRRHPKRGRALHSRRELLAAYRALARERGWQLPEARLAERLRTCPTRSLSGITPVTVLTKPFPCPGRCVFCPSDVRMPKSYLAAEPGCQRATANRFDPYLQTWNRLFAYRDMGHPTDKVELLVLGGTWSHYPAAYRRWFLVGCLEALEDFGRGCDRREAAARRTAVPLLPAAAPAAAAGRYNAWAAAERRARVQRGLPEPAERAGWAELAAAQQRNEAAGCRCVGLSVETRPDCVTPAEVEGLRRLGVTKLQLGVQSLSDEILARNGRGHDVAATRRALALLRGAGFKLQVHWMPNLLGATPASDAADFTLLFADPGFRPDELKIYPCSLVESAELVRQHADGSWRPYAHEELVELLADCLRRVPAWCRVTRVIRDIPSTEIRAGNRRTNLREEVEARLQARGAAPREIRAREVRGRAVRVGALRRIERAYATGIGQERFLEFATAEGRIAGFLRLSLPERPAPLAELAGCALVRELHVYGPATSLGERVPGHAQHAGLGARLLERARAIAREAGYPGLAVISASGTRGYYRRLGFRDGALYQYY